MHLGNLRRAESSRVALVGLSDSSAIVRATAAHAVLSLSPSEVITALVPLLTDKSEFVRQSAAYSLGTTRSRGAVEHLVDRWRLIRITAGSRPLSPGEIEMTPLHSSSNIWVAIQSRSTGKFRVDGKEGQNCNCGGRPGPWQIRTGRCSPCKGFVR